MSATKVSIVIPCRNEADSIATAIAEAQSALSKISGASEVIVVDNGSDDGSRDLIEASCARMIDAQTIGYGAALKAGLAAASGRFVIMGDADGSYDFHAAPDLVARLESGDALVVGCRRPAWGGTIEPGAMPFLHRALGNPALSTLVRCLFPVQVHDVYCGLRGFSREHFEQLAIDSDQMTFAVEMIIKFALAGYTISEIPTVLRRDTRSISRSHLRTWRDGWATLTLILISWQRHLRGTLRVFR